jgi:hypothetical protein
LALSIGISVGSKIRVGNDIVEVVGTAKPNLIVLKVNGGEDIVVSDLRSTEILPRVFVFSGMGQNGGSNRIAFECPREIRIQRLE